MHTQHVNCLYLVNKKRLSSKSSIHVVCFEYSREAIVSIDGKPWRSYLIMFLILSFALNFENSHYEVSFKTSRFPAYHTMLNILKDWLILSEEMSWKGTWKCFKWFFRNQSIFNMIVLLLCVFIDLVETLSQASTF